MRVSRVGTEETAPTAEVTVTVTKADGSTVTKTATVAFYERACQVKDFVYADGTYSDIYDEGKTVVAICSYVDPTAPKEAPRRLGVAPRPIGLYQWGPDIMLTLSDIFNDGVTPENIPDIPNIHFNSGTPSSAQILDGDSPDGFKQYAASELFRAGFTVANAQGSTWESGDLVPLGKVETSSIIAMRNRVLRDSGINLPIPAAIGDENEYACFTRLLAAANNTPGQGYRYYFPAASAAFAYEPRVKPDENLAPVFKVHNWFLPTPGDLQRISNYFRSSGIFTRLSSLMGLQFDRDVWTTGEHSSANYAYHAELSSGYVESNYDSPNKKNSKFVYPMVAF